MCIEQRYNNNNHKSRKTLFSAIIEWTKRREAVCCYRKVLCGRSSLVSYLHVIVWARMNEGLKHTHTKLREWGKWVFPTFFFAINSVNFSIKCRAWKQRSQSNDQQQLAVMLRHMPIWVEVKQHTFTHSRVPVYVLMRVDIYVRAIYATVF